MLESGTQVTARPSGWDSPSYDGSKEEIEGTLTIEEVEGYGPFPSFTLHLVNGRPVDPTTIKPTNLTAAATEIKAAGLAVIAKDTGRVLLLQRALIDDDPSAGKWEFPGGHLQPNEEPLQGAIREWAEETGLKLPKGNITGTWTNNVYQGFVYEIPRESDLDINLDHEDRKVLNPDDPDGDEIEVIAWFDPVDLPDNPALREEVKGTNWALLASAAPCLEFANPCHDPANGRFCETHGTVHEARVHPNQSVESPYPSKSNRATRLETIRALSIIGKIHSVDLPDPEVDSASLEYIDSINDDEHLYGEYYPHTNEMFIVNNPEFAKSAMVHEYGHFLSLGPAGIFDQGNAYLDEQPLIPEFDGLRNAVLSSKSFKNITTKIATTEPDYADYLRGTDEVWARAYTQWISTKSGDHRLQDQVRRLGENSGYWTNEDFAPIFTEMEKIFESEGLLKRRGQ